MSEKRKITFIVNPISGGHEKEEIIEMINQGMDAERFDINIRITEYAGHAVEIAHECATQGIDIVAAVGGDGTINEVARALTHTNTAMGIVPCGSGNGLARHLCIPMNTRKAIDILNQAVIMDFDYGVINNIPFFCTCGMGFDALVSMKFAEAGKRGLATYVEKVARESLAYKPDTYTLEDETGIHRYKAFLLACANAAQYGNNAYIAPRASMQDGLLDIIVMEPFNVLEAPGIAMELFAKTLNNNQHIKTFQARRVHIHREKAGAVHYDGDPLQMGTEIDIEIQPRGFLAVVNPAVTEDAAAPNKMLNAVSSLVNKIKI